ncbi:MAG TPA: MauE/DoxX family redox-associated membrane protein [Thermoanaerobaculia bacterium]|nr:MauE/DoxX family redox-associated membrane protein [Thermoanaerobaculia bacterium]
MGKEIAHPPSWRRWAGRLGSWWLAAVLLVAVLAKAADPIAFAEQLQLEGLTGPLAPQTAALVALGIEAVLGLGLLLGLRHAGWLTAVSALVVFFLAITARGWWRAAHGLADSAACGCFGNLLQRTPAEAFWQDLLLMAPALALAWLGRARFPHPAEATRWALALGGAAAVVLLGWHAPQLPLDDLATRLAPGVEVARLCAGGEPQVCVGDVAPELLEGNHWVVLLDLEDDPAAWVDDLNAYVYDGGEPPLLALTASPPDRLQAFTWDWGPAFPVREAPAELLRPLYRELPRSFLVEEGEVVVTSRGLPPQANGAAPGGDEEIE